MARRPRVTCLSPFCYLPAEIWILVRSLSSLLVVCPPPATCRLLRHEEGIFSNCRRYQTINRRELFGYDCRVLNCWLLIRSTTEILIANNVICWQLIHIASSLSGGIMSSFTSETQLIFNPLKSSWQINSIILKVACWPTEEGGELIRVIVSNRYF